MKNKIFSTAHGWAGITASGKGIVQIVLPKKSRKAVERELVNAECPRLRHSRAGSMRSAERSEGTALVSKAAKLLQTYFSGQRVVFDLPLDFLYHTPFQRSVWKAAAAIPYGETRSYAWIASRIGRPLAARAAGQAMGANPIPIIIP